MSFWCDKTGLINRLEEEKIQLRKLLEEYVNNNAKHIKSLINLNKEKNDLKEELEKLKQSGQKFCYLDEFVRINKESLIEKMELKEQNIHLRNKVKYMSELINSLKNSNKVISETLENVEKAMRRE
jgi:hypothetical protein